MHRVERHAGTAAAVVALGGILLATLLDPTFTWTRDALSHLGVREASALAFNGTLVVAGGLGAAYGFGVVRIGQSRRRWVVGALFVVASISLAGVGIFVTGHRLHLPAAVGFYLLATLAMLLDALDRRDEATGQLTGALAVGHLLVWATWARGMWPGDALALPEFAGAVVVALWILAVGPAPSIRPRAQSWNDRPSRDEPSP